MIDVNKIYNSDCFEKIKDFPDNSIDMIITSPPYPEKRKKHYETVSIEKYVDWFLPLAKEIKRVLSWTGSFFLNIKPQVKKGERCLFLMDLVIALKREIGFYYLDEFSWIKNPYPSCHPGHLKNGFEPIYHFSKGKSSEITFNPLACGAAIKKESIKRSYRNSNPKSDLRVKVKNIRDLKLVRPSNVIHCNNVINQYMGKADHPAVFPLNLIIFFIKTFSNENDIILDVFGGSGTVGLACKHTNRNFIIVEKKKEYCDLAERIIFENKFYIPEDENHLFKGVLNDN